MNARKLISITGSLVVFAVIICAVFYFLNLSILDSLLPDQLRESRELKRIKKYFPDSLGEYSLIGESEYKIEVLNSCHKIEDNFILKQTGKTGDACMETFSAVYGTVAASSTSIATSSIVKVSLSRFTKSADLLDLLVEKTTNSDIVNDQPVFRTAPFRLGWSPISSFDLIVTDEGQSVVTPVTNSTKYDGIASGNNEVMRYFISKYPSKR